MKNSFAGKNIVVGVTGSVAAFKVAGWVSELARNEAQVSVVMTESAEKFIAPLTFHALSGNTVYTDMFNRQAAGDMAHIELGRNADLVIIAPASASSIARLAAGSADNLLAATLLVARCRVLVFPAMNPAMYSHPATRKNIEQLREYGYDVIEPASGTMACREEGTGRLVEWDVALHHVNNCLVSRDLTGEKITVTAGPTREAIDPARFLSNRSSGKMGYALAKAAQMRGADVTLVTGPTALPAPLGVTTIKVESAREMYEAVLASARDASIVIKAAAVADYGPETYCAQKVKKEHIGQSLQLKQNPDILLELGRTKQKGQILVGFAAESENLLKEGRRKLEKKNLDLVVVNDINARDAGFEVDFNRVILVSREDEQPLPHTTKLQVAQLILDRILSLKNRKNQGL